MDFNVLSWNMAGGNWHFKDNFINNMERFFDHINGIGLAIDVICSQEVIADARFWDAANKQWSKPWGEYPGYQPGGLIKGIEKRFQSEGYHFNAVSHQIKPIEHGENEYEAKVIWSRHEIASFGDQIIVSNKTQSEGDNAIWSRTVVSAEINLGGIKVYVFNYHGPNLGNISAKVEYAQKVEQYVRDVTSGFIEPFILTGDFNLRASDYEPFSQYPQLRLNTAQTSWLDWQLSNLPSVRDEIAITPAITDHNKLYLCKYTL